MAEPARAFPEALDLALAASLVTSLSREPWESEQEGGSRSPPQTTGRQGQWAVGQGTRSL